MLELVKTQPALKRGGGFDPYMMRLPKELQVELDAMKNGKGERMPRLWYELGEVLKNGGRGARFDAMGKDIPDEGELTEKNVAVRKGPGNAGQTGDGGPGNGPSPGDPGGQRGPPNGSRGDTSGGDTGCNTSGHDVGNTGSDANPVGNSNGNPDANTGVPEANPGNGQTASSSRRQKRAPPGTAPC